MKRAAANSSLPASSAVTTDADRPQAEVYRGVDGLDRVAADWAQILGRQFRQRFLHWHGWYRAYLENLADDPGDVWFFLLRHGAAPVAVVPLQRLQSRMLGKSIRRWRLPRHAHLPMADIPCIAGVVASELLSSLRAALDEHAGGWDIIEFAPVLEESPLATGWRPGAAGAFISQDKTCDQLECLGSFDDIKAGFSRNFRSNLNKARNKLKKSGDVRTARVTSQPQLQAAFKEFLTLESSGWKGQEGAATAIGLHPELTGFYQALIDRLGGKVVVNSLYVDERLIASQFCVRDQDTLYILKLAYDESHARLAPGNMLLEQVIHHGIDSGDWRYVNLVGNPPWFRSWAPQSQGIWSIRLCNDTGGGRLMRLVLHSKARLAPAYRWYRQNIGNRRQQRR